MTDKEMWYETLHAGFGQYFSVDKVLYREQTGHQDLVIFENSALAVSYTHLTLPTSDLV